MRRLLLLAFFCAVVLAGYSTPPSVASDTAAFKGAEAPPKGYVRLHILRPGFSNASRDDRPIVAMNSVDVVELAHATYTSLVLNPGTYEVSTRPNLGEAGFWQGSFRISMEAADRTYFLAFWNDTAVGVGSLGAMTPYLGLLGHVLDNSVRSTAVRFEVIGEADAIAVLKDLSYVSPRDVHIGSRP
jgi:hypothetical protein